MKWIPVEAVDYDESSGVIDCRRLFLRGGGKRSRDAQA